MAVRRWPELREECGYPDAAREEAVLTEATRVASEVFRWIPNPRSDRRFTLQNLQARAAAIADKPRSGGEERVRGPEDGSAPSS